MLKCLRTGKNVSADECCEFFELEKGKSEDDVRKFLECKEKLEKMYSNVNLRKLYINCLGRLLKSGCKCLDDVEKFMEECDVDDNKYLRVWKIYEGRDVRKRKVKRKKRLKVDKETREEYEKKLEKFREFLKKERLEERTINEVIRITIRLLVNGIEDPYEAKRYGGCFYGYAMRKYLEWKEKYEKGGDE